MAIGDRVISKKELETLSRNLSRQIKAVRSHAVGGYKTFLDLEDTPDSFVGKAGQVVGVDDSEAILGFRSIGASPLDVLGTPTYSSIQDWLNLTQSAGKTTPDSPLSAHAPANGTLDVAAGTGFIKTTDSPIGVTKFFNWDAINLALDDGVTSYIYVDYTAGSPVPKKTTTRADIEMNRHFTLGRAYRDGNTVHFVNSGTDLTNTARRDHERLVGVRGFERDSGGVISESGERFLESTAGVSWLGANKIVTAAQDTNNGDRFTKWYHVGGVWNSATGQQQVDNTQYDNGTNLVNLTANKYGTMWCYIDYDSHLVVVYGSQNGTLTQAQAADPPDVPSFIRDFAILAARIIVQQGTVNIIEFKSAYEVFFPHTTPSEHNDMGSLQGGQADQYYHFNTAEHTKLAEVARIGVGANLLRARYSAFQSFGNGDAIGSPGRAAGVCDTSDFIIGDRCLKFTWNVANANGFLYLGSDSTDYNIRLKPSTKYIVSYYAKAATGTPEIRVHFRQDDGVLILGTAHNMTTSWARYECIIETDGNLTDSGLLRLTSYGFEIDVWFDAIQVEEASAAGSPLASEYKPGIIAGPADLLADLSANAGAAFNWNAQNLINVGNVSISEYLYRSGDVDTFIRYLANRINLHAGGVSGINIQGDGSNKIEINDFSADVDTLIHWASGTGLKVEGSSGDVSLPTGRLTFPATQNPSAGVNTLDDYEEGTWTPQYLCSGTQWDSITHDSTILGGRYTKIGREVFIQGAIRTDAITMGGASGTLILTGLPFTAANIYYTGSFGISWSYVWGANNYPCVIEVTRNTATAKVRKHADTDADGAITTDVAVTGMVTGVDDNHIIFTGKYMI